MRVPTQNLVTNVSNYAFKHVHFVISSTWRYFPSWLSFKYVIWELSIWGCPPSYFRQLYIAQRTDSLVNSCVNLLVRLLLLVLYELYTALPTPWTSWLIVVLPRAPFQSLQEVPPHVSISQLWILYPFGRNYVTVLTKWERSRGGKRPTVSLKSICDVACALTTLSRSLPWNNLVKAPWFRVYLLSSYAVWFVRHSVSFEKSVPCHEERQWLDCPTSMWLVTITARVKREPLECKTMYML